jgi:hypothetical protein
MENDFNTQETDVNSQQTEMTQDVTPNVTENKPAEKMLPQSEVNRIVAATKKQMQERYEQQRTGNPAQPVVQETPEQAARRVFQEELTKANQIRQQEYAKSQQQAEWQNLVTSLATKIEEGSKKYEDWDTVTADVNFAVIPQVLKAANDVENSADVLYELSKNPSKLGAVLPFLQSNDKAMQALGKKEIAKLSLSLKNNELAQNRVAPKRPLDPIKPSSVKPDDGKATWSDLRSKYIAKV